MSFSGLLCSSPGISGPLWVYMQLHGRRGFDPMRCKPQPPTGYTVVHSTSKGPSLCNVSVCVLWVCGGCLRDWSIACGMCRYVFVMGVWRLLGGLLRMLTHGPTWASLGASHRLPTTRLHPEKGTIKKQTQTSTQTTETMHKQFLLCSVCRSLGVYGRLLASLGLSGHICNCM